jgi:hypothetical protein
VGIKRLELSNNQPLVQLLYHPYQHAFFEARRLRTCPAGHFWSFLTAGAYCPECLGRHHKHVLVAQPDLPLDFLGQRAYYTLVPRAGRRGGKTRSGALSVIEELQIPGSLWWACAPSYPKLRDYVLPNFFKQMPTAWLQHPKTDWKETDLTLILPNGSSVQFRSLEDPDRGRGPGLDGLWIDEVCELTLEHWEVISPALADKAGVFLGTTTPKGEDWVHDTFFVPAELREPGYWACSYTTLDNPWMQQPRQRAYVERQRRSMTQLMFRQEYLAEIVTFTGAIYGELVTQCIIEGTPAELQFYFPEWPQLDTSRPSITGLDPGTDHPFAGCHLVGSPRGLVAVGEYEERARVFQIHAAHIHRMRRGFDGPCAIDRSQAQAQLELSQYGLFTSAAENDVIAGINRLSAWMIKSAHAPGKYPTGLVLPKSLVPKSIKRLSAYRWADNKKSDGQTKRELVFKSNDDLPDAYRYGVMTYPHLPEADPVQTPGIRDLSQLDDKTRLEIERERRSRTASGDDGLELLDDDLVPVTGTGDFNA